MVEKFTVKEYLQLYSVACFILQMMAELMFRKNDYESAMFNFQQLLERKPGNKAGERLSL